MLIMLILVITLAHDSSLQKHASESLSVFCDDFFFLMNSKLSASLLFRVQVSSLQLSVQRNGACGKQSVQKHFCNRLVVRPSSSCATLHTLSELFHQCEWDLMSLKLFLTALVIGLLLMSLCNCNLN